MNNLSYAKSYGVTCSPEKAGFEKILRSDNINDVNRPLNRHLYEAD